MTDRKRTLIYINLLIACIAMSFLFMALSADLPPIMAASMHGMNMAFWGMTLVSAAMLAMVFKMIPGKENKTYGPV